MEDLSSLYSSIKDQFKQKDMDDPAFEARELILGVLDIKNEEFVLNPSYKIPSKGTSVVNRAVGRRLDGEPLSRILGKRGFWKDEFYISPETLDPRADSEMIIQAALDDMPRPPDSIIDLGTGSGCLLLSLLREWPQAQGWGLDISPGAIVTAQKNADHLGLSERTRFICSDWSGYEFKQRFDLVVSNPPYIASGVIPALAPEVRLHDPLKALDGGADGLDAYRSLAALLPRILDQDGLAVLEIGYDQALSVPPLFSGFRVLRTVADFGGNPRVLVLARA